jgi:hypothetical protein
MRPHVEIIDEKDLLWHMAEFPHATGTARQRHLNYCEEKGEASLSVEMKGDPVNWGPEYPGTQEPVLLQPVRSRSIGDWQNRHYQ